MFVDPELAQYSVEQRRSDFPTTVGWDRGGAPVRMLPAFVTACLSR